MKKLYLLFIIPFFISSIYSQDIFKLNYFFEKGKVYRYLDEIKVKSTQEMMGREMRMDTKIEMLSKFNVDSVLENGNYILSIEIDSMRMEISSKVMDTVISSKNVSALNRKIEIDKFGNIINKKKTDKIALGTMIMDEMMPDKFELHIFSDKDLKIGDKWETVSYDTIDAKGTKIVSKTKVVYKLLKREKKFERDCLKIEYEAETESEGKVDMAGQELYVEGDVSTEGVFWFDNLEKLLVYEEADVTDNTTLAHTGENALIIPITQKTKLVRKLIK